DGSHYELSFGGGYTPAPALSTQVRPEKRAELCEIICRKIDEVARQYNVVRTRVQLSPLCWLNELNRAPVEFDRFGYAAVPLATQVVALDRPFPELLQHMRKGHVYDVKKGLRCFDITCYGAEE